MGPLSIGLNAAVPIPSQPRGREGSLDDLLAGAGQVAGDALPRSGADAGGSAGGGDRLGSFARAGLVRSNADEAGEAARVMAEDEGPDGLTPAEEDAVSDLRARDTEVRRHEEAHARVGGQYAGTPSYTYQTGPDGKRYAIGGEVSIDVAPVPDDPEATIAKMAVVKRAALAPAEPSGQDRRVAALADSQSLEARATLNAQRLEDQATRLSEVSGSAVQAPARPPRFVQANDTLGRGADSDPGQLLMRSA